MPCPDLLLIREGSLLKAFVPADKLSVALRQGEGVTFMGTHFEDCGSCCEWLEVVDTNTNVAVGVSLVDFYEPLAHESLTGLKANNVIWNSDGEAVFLFSACQSWRNQPGPYLPVNFLKSADGRQCYFIREGLPSTDEESPRLPVIEGA